MFYTFTNWVASQNPKSINGILKGFRSLFLFQFWGLGTLTETWTELVNIVNMVSSPLTTLPLKGLVNIIVVKIGEIFRQDNNNNFSRQDIGKSNINFLESWMKTFRRRSFLLTKEKLFF